MQYKVQRIDDAIVIMLEGRLLSEQETSAIRNQLATELNNQQHKFIFDLKGIEFVNSACLNFLVSSKNIISSKNGAMVLCNVSDQLDRLLSVTKLDSFFSKAGKTSDALEMLKTG